MDHVWIATGYVPAGEEDHGHGRRYCRACHATQAFVPGKTPGRIPAGRWLPAAPRTCTPVSPYITTEAVRAARHRERTPRKHRKRDRWWLALRQLSKRARAAAIASAHANWPRAFTRWSANRRQPERSHDS